jgi:hypothetical protein
MKASPRTSMPGTVEDRIAIFRPDVRPFLLALRELVRNGAWTAEMIVDAKLFADSPFDKKGTRAQKIRALQAFVDIVTLPEGDDAS